MAVSDYLLEIKGPDLKGESQDAQFKEALKSILGVGPDTMPPPTTLGRVAAPEKCRTATFKPRDTSTRPRSCFSTS
jgi:hypothetical protein